MIKLMRYEENTGLYMARAESIVEIYNSTVSFWAETLNLKKPSNTLIICSERHNGGLLLDSHPEFKAYRLMFAAFEKEDRAKGLLSRCMNFAELIDIDIAFVEIAPSGSREIWQHLGYTIEGYVNYCPFLANRNLKEAP